MITYDVKYMHSNYASAVAPDWYYAYDVTSEWIQSRINEGYVMVEQKVHSAEPEPDAPPPASFGQLLFGTQIKSTNKSVNLSNLADEPDLTGFNPAPTVLVNTDRFDLSNTEWGNIFGAALIVFNNVSSGGRVKLKGVGADGNYFEYFHDIPSPSKAGYAYWSWYYIIFPLWYNDNGINTDDIYTVSVECGGNVVRSRPLTIINAPPKPIKNILSNSQLITGGVCFARISVTNTSMINVQPRPAPLDGTGDINNDGYITRDDVNALMQHIYNGDPYDAKYDINKNGLVDMGDTVPLSQYMLGYNRRTMIGPPLEGDYASASFTVKVRAYDEQYASYINQQKTNIIGPHETYDFDFTFNVPENITDNIWVIIEIYAGDQLVPTILKSNVTDNRVPETKFEYIKPLKFNRIIPLAAGWNTFLYTDSDTTWKIFDPILEYIEEMYYWENNTWKVFTHNTILRTNTTLRVLLSSDFS